MKRLLFLGFFLFAFGLLLSGCANTNTPADTTESAPPVSETEAPETEAPETEAPETEVPETAVPAPEDSETVPPEEEEPAPPQLPRISMSISAAAVECARWASS